MSILCDSGTDADALSTTVFALGPEAGLALAEKLEGVEALLVLDDGTVLRTSGVTDEIFAETK